MHVRGARPADLTAIAGVFLACWQRSYAEVLPAEVVASFDERDARELWRPHLEPEVAEGLLVAEVDAGSTEATGDAPLVGQLVGVALVRPEEGYLASLYVAPDLTRLGAGRRLFSESARRCRLAAAPRMRWWVFAANVGGHAFYAAQGARPTGLSRMGEYGVTELELELTW